MKQPIGSKAHRKPFERLPKPDAAVLADLRRRYDGGDITVAGGDAEIDSAFERFSKLHVDALFVGTGSLFNNLRQKIVSLAARFAIPAIYLARESVEIGGLMSYGANEPEAFRVAGTYAGKIFKGEKPGNLPVMQPAKFELAINLRTAKMLGLTVPQTLLVAATDLIE